MSKLRSMTGFGRSVQSKDNYSLVFEVRSVNGRFLDIKWRLPAFVRSHENIFEKIVRKYTSRGRVEISLSLQNNAKAETVSFDNAQAHAMLDALSEFAKTRNNDFTIDYNGLLRITSLWNGNEEAITDDFIQFVQDSLKDALVDWNVSRTTEASDLSADLQNRFAKMQEWLQKIEERAPQIKELRFTTVKERLQEVLNSLESNLDESRFLQEMVILSDKLDVSEETTRLHSHFKRLDSLLKTGDEAGRKLDFTLQECFREINTCGNKIQDAELSILVVEFKNELEKCREQVQNLE